MSRTVTISDELAARLEKLRAEEGFASLDAVAEALMGEVLQDGDEEWDEETLVELRALIAEADASPTADWDGAAVRAEVLRRHALRNRQV